MVGPRLFKDDKPPRQGAIRHTAPKSIGKYTNRQTSTNDFTQSWGHSVKTWELAELLSEWGVSE